MRVRLRKFLAFSQNEHGFSLRVELYPAWHTAVRQNKRTASIFDTRYPLPPLPFLDAQIPSALPAYVGFHPILCRLALMFSSRIRRVPQPSDVRPCSRCQRQSACVENPSASYAVLVHRAGTLPPASFRFQLTMVPNVMHTADFNLHRPCRTHHKQQKGVKMLAVCCKISLWLAI
jgi:hypothetical protein